MTNERETFQDLWLLSEYYTNVLNKFNEYYNGEKIQNKPICIMC